LFIITDKNEGEGGRKTEAVGVMKDEDLKLERRVKPLPH
jgi:hypothetical protein